MPPRCAAGPRFVSLRSGAPAAAVLCVPVSRCRRQPFARRRRAKPLGEPIVLVSPRSRPNLRRIVVVGIEPPNRVPDRRDRRLEEQSRSTAPYLVPRESLVHAEQQRLAGHHGLGPDEAEVLLFGGVDDRGCLRDERFDVLDVPPEPRCCRSSTRTPRAPRAAPPVSGDHEPLVEPGEGLRDQVDPLLGASRDQVTK